MNSLRSHQQIALASIQCFTDDGTLDMGELNFLLGLALRDDIIDKDEKRVLNDIFNRVAEGDVNSNVWARIQEVKNKYNI